MRLSVVVTLACLTLNGLCAANNACASTSPSLNIPPQGLGPALETLARDCKLQMVFASEDVEQLRTRGVRGALTPHQALTQLLSGTGMIFKFLDDNTIAIVAIPNHGGGKHAQSSITTQSEPAGGRGMESPDPRNSPRDEPAASASGAVIQTDASASRVDQGPGLDEVIVTAQKRSENLDRIPISAMAITKSDLDHQGIKDFSDIARVVPGLNFQTVGPFGQTAVTVHGIFSTVGAATTGVYIDETPVQERNDSYLFPIYSQLFDIERVEVLRGPQGTLYGSGSEGGTLRFIPTPPSLEKTTVYTRGEVAQTQEGAPSYELGGAVGGPVIADKLGFRVSLWGREDGGWIDRTASSIYSDGHTLTTNSNGQDAASGRVALLWQPTTDLTVEPTFFYQHTLKKDTDLYWEAEGPYQQEGKQRQPNEVNYALFSNSVQYDLESFSLKSITSYMNARGNRQQDWSYSDLATLTGQIAVPGLDDFTGILHVHTNQNMWTQELRATSTDSGSERISWVTGLFWQQSKTRAQTVEVEPLFNDLFLTVFGAPVQDVLGAPMMGNVSYTDDLHTTERQFAGYGDLTVKISDRLKSTFGLRVARSDYSFSTLQNGAWNSGLTLGTGSQRETPVTPKAILSYALDEGLVYASAAKGYRTGGANSSLAGIAACDSQITNVLGLKDVPGSYKSDTVWSYELGAKERALNDRLDLSVSAYWVDWSSIQGNVVLQCGWAYTTNLGAAVSRGVDASAKALVLENLTLGLGVGYDDAHYTQTSSLSNGEILARKGDTLPTPSLTAAFSAEYHHQLNADMSGYARTDANYSSVYNRNPEDGVFGADPSVRRASALALDSVRIGVRRGAIDASLFVSNLFDNKAEIYRYHYPYNFEYFLAQTSRPRTIGLTFTSNF